MRSLGVKSLGDSRCVVGDGNDSETNANKPLEGEVVVVTGKVGTWTRTEVKEIIENAGGVAGSSVSFKTTLLVCPSDSTSSKTRKAKSLGVRTMTPEEFVNVVGKQFVCEA